MLRIQCCVAINSVATSEIFSEILFHPKITTWEAFGYYYSPSFLRPRMALLQKLSNLFYF